MQINSLMEKLYRMEKNLGGTSYTAKSSGDEFMNIKEVIVQKLHMIRKKMEEKDKKFKEERNTDIIRLELEIKDMINETDGQLVKMNEALRKQVKDKKKYNETNINQKQRIYDNMRSQVQDFQSFLVPDADSAEKVETISEIKSKLMGERKGLPKKQPKEATTNEKDAIQRWQQNDVQMDAQLDLIVAGTGQWKANAQLMGSKIDHTMEQINRLDAEVDITNAELNKQNSALKAIVEKYRSPNKFCMDIVMICVILGLAAAIYTTVSG